MNRTPFLVANVLIIATCGLIYELQAATLSSFILGDSITQFSLIIGLYLSSMGVGAWLSRFLDRNLVRAFLEVELGVALVGGLSVPILYLLYASQGIFVPVLYGIVFVVGTLVGLELPLLMRILGGQLEFKELVARVLSFDYVGALFASVLFPLFFVPQMGLMRTSIFFGMLNACVALLGTWLLRPLISGGIVGLRLRSLLLLIGLAYVWIDAPRWSLWIEEEQFEGRILFAATTPYQRIVVTESRQGFQLHLNAHLQFSSLDEYRYHEALAHPAMLTSRQRRRVLILGGGDGLALREVLRYPDVDAVTLVDIDPAMTRLASTLPPFVRLNESAYADPRVTVVNADAMIWLENCDDRFDVVLIDFPDPHHFALGKLYTSRFYKLLRERLNDEGAVAIQSTSPLATRKSYWCIMRTLEASGFVVRPYQAAMPSFGIWGFALAGKKDFEMPQGKLPEGLRFLDDATLKSMFVIPSDLRPVPVEVNRLDNQRLVRYYEMERRGGE